MDKKILIVDDDIHIQQLLNQFLKNEGWVIHVSGDGAAAIGKISKYKYDLIILDINMPGINGFKTLSIIRENEATKDIPVLMLTMSKNMDDVVKARALRITDYIIKPPTKEQLIKRVRRAMGTENPQT